MNEPSDISKHDIESLLPEFRKNADEDLRQQVSDILRDLLLHVVSLDTYLGRIGEESLRARTVQTLETTELLIDRIQSPPYAYSPYLTYDHIPAEVESYVLKCAAAVLNETERLIHLLEPTLDAKSDFNGILDTLGNSLTRLDTRLEERINAIMEFG